jgi:gamma-glutamyltranspeptidase/glutathione hydrolase
MQAIINLIDHGMDLQHAVEAPRVWTQGQQAELEAKIGEPVKSALAKRGHDVASVQSVGGGMCAIEFEAEGSLRGAACWRADGTAMGMGGGLSRPGARFVPEQRRS